MDKTISQCGELAGARYVDTLLQEAPAHSERLLLLAVDGEARLAKAEREAEAWRADAIRAGVRWHDTHLLAYSMGWVAGFCAAINAALDREPWMAQAYLALMRQCQGAAA